MRLVFDRNRLVSIAPCCCVLELCSKLHYSVLASMWCMQYAGGANGFHTPPPFLRVTRHRIAPYFWGTGLRLHGGQLWNQRQWQHGVSKPVAQEPNP